MDRDKAARRAANAAVFVMLGIFPLFTGFHGYTALTISKFVFLVCTAVVLVLLPPALQKPKRPRGAVLWMAAFAAVCLISALVSPYFPQTLIGAGRWDGLVTRLCCLVLFFSFAEYTEPSAHHLVAYCAAMCLCCAVAACQLGGLNPLHLFPVGLDYYGGGSDYPGRFLGTIGNVDLLAGALCLMIPAAGTAFVLDMARRRWLWLLCAAFGAWVLGKADVDAGIIGLLVWALVLPPLTADCAQRLRRWALCLGVVLAAIGLAGHGILCISGAVLAAVGQLIRRERRWSRVLWFGEALLLCAAAVIVFFLPQRAGALGELARLLHGEWDPGFGSGRLGIWQATARLIPERPLLGGGPGTLVLRLDMVFSRPIPEAGQTVTAVVDSAHNDWLGLLADTGLIGFGTYLAALWLLTAGLLRRRADGACAVLLAALIGYWAQGLFGLDLCVTSPLLWSAMGLAGAKVGKQDAAEEAPSASVLS